ncbi:hypothetical protein PR001_g7300 [Phytophthora rubi]|uniref:Uncharacterized protein n=1 Tax=Phytophthora rubi TaxID=129364 RepID=A0A6A3P6V7_9STRA|nr:hypothetical protein PR001_g7300 [Phytophthora rubi]KAE9048560.1 hypothetical protein PR002_g366 [Phytophthora rubi]
MNGRTGVTGRNGRSDSSRNHVQKDLAPNEVTVGRKRRLTGNGRLAYLQNTNGVWRTTADKPRQSSVENLPRRARAADDESAEYAEYSLAQHQRTTSPSEHGRQPGRRHGAQDPHRRAA